MNTPRFWQRPNALSLALLPIALLYRLGAWMDRNNQKAKRASIPVLSIGNVTAGGAGKTPTVLALLPMLRALGFTPHVLTRGYKAKVSHTAYRVMPADDYHHVGDEALLLAAQAPTWVGSERFASAEAAAQAGATLAVCDDALQHYRLQKDVSLLVIDGPYGFGNGQLLPAGPLRETLTSALARCDAAIIIGEDKQNIAARIPLPVFHARLTPAALQGQNPWFAFAGIGRPEKFYETLRGLNANLVGTRDFADHHAYTEEDLNALRAQADILGAKLITTAKDAVKLAAAFRAEVTVLPVELVFDAPEALRSFLQQKLHLQA